MTCTELANEWKKIVVDNLEPGEESLAQVIAAITILAKDIADGAFIADEHIIGMIQSGIETLRLKERQERMN